MTIRHKLIAALLLAFPVAPVLPLLAQEPNPPAEQNQQLDPQSATSEQPARPTPPPVPLPPGTYLPYVPCAVRADLQGFRCAEGAGRGGRRHRALLQ